MVVDKHVNQPIGLVQLCSTKEDLQTTEIEQPSESRRQLLGTFNPTTQLVRRAVRRRGQRQGRYRLFVLNLTVFCEKMFVQKKKTLKNSRKQPSDREARRNGDDE